MTNPTDNWSFKPQRIFMHSNDYRDIVIWGLVEDGWTRPDAEAEADRRLAEMETGGEIADDNPA